MRKLIKPVNPSHSPTSGKAKLPNLPEFFVKWDYAQNRLEIEFNPADYTREESLELCPFALLETTVEYTIRHVLAVDRVLPVFAENSDYYLGTYDFRSDWNKLINISRIDLARDYFISDQRFSLEQLRHTYPSRSRGQASSQYRNDGQLNTLSFPASDGTTKLKLYDKHEERQRNLKKIFGGMPIPRGTFRFEASFPREQLNYINMKTLDLFTPVRLERLIKHKWEDSKFWVNLIWEGQSARDANASLMTPQRINEVLGFIHSQYFDIPMNYKYREIRDLLADAKTLGLKPRKTLYESGCEYGHLDFNSGDIGKPLASDFSLSNDDLFGMIYANFT